MATTVRDTIKEITRKHLSEGKGKCYGQCLTAVGWVGGTLPEMYEEEGMVEFSMSDVSNGSIATGIALAGGRPIYVVRYQGFQWYNLASVVNYAAKSKEIWNRPCPIFVRSIAMEGGVGPVAGSSHHSLAHRMPGIKVISPMTPGEYEYAYSCFMNDDEPYYVSEHRKSYDNTEELENIILPETDFTIFPISITRLEMKKLLELAKQENINLNIKILSNKLNSIRSFLLISSERCSIFSNESFHLAKPYIFQSVYVNRKSAKCEPTIPVIPVIRTLFIIYCFYTTQ